MAQQIVHKQFVGTPVIKDGSIVFRCSDASEDRVGDRVFPDGINTDRYLANPVVLWNHDTTIPAIATGKVWVEDGALLMEPTFSTANPLGAQIKAQVEAGELRAVSIGFIPLEGKPNDLGGMDWMSIELTEVSIVNVPCHPGALREKTMNPEEEKAALERILAAFEESYGKLFQNLDLLHDEMQALKDTMSKFGSSPESESEEEKAEEPAPDADEPESTDEPEEDELQKFFALFASR